MRGKSRYLRDWDFAQLLLSLIIDDSKKYPMEFKNALRSESKMPK